MRDLKAQMKVGQGRITATMTVLLVLFRACESGFANIRLKLIGFLNWTAWILCMIVAVAGLPEAKEARTVQAPAPTAT